MENIEKNETWFYLHRMAILKAERDQAEDRAEQYQKRLHRAHGESIVLLLGVLGLIGYITLYSLCAW